MKRHMLSLLLLVTVLVFSSASQAQDVVEITFMGWEASPLETESVMQGLERFMEMNPHIRVDYIAGIAADHHTKLLTMMAGGAAPDVFFMGDGLYRDFQKRGVLLDITDYFYAELDLDDFIPIDQEKMLIDDRVYGISSCIVGGVLYYNRDIFDRAGMPYPPSDPKNAWTWDEFQEVAKQLTVSEGRRTSQFGAFGLENAINWTALIRSAGGDTFNEDYSAITLDDPRAKDVLQKILDLRQVHGASPAAFYMEEVGMSAAQMLQTGRVAMLADGSWALQELARMGFPVGVGVLPVFDEPRTSGGAHLHSIWSGTPHPEEAWRLVEFLSSEEYQIDLVRSGLWMPNRTAMYAEDRIGDWLTEGVHPEGFEGVAELFANYARINPVIKTPQEAWDVMEEELEYFWHDGQPIDSVVERLTARVNALLAEDR